MPSPFPGVDLYLEAVGEWSDFHAGLIYLMARKLTPLIRPRYHARIDRHVFALQEERFLVPDVALLENQKAPAANGPSVAAAASDTALLIEEDEERFADEERQGFIRIEDRRDGNRVVTQIEVLSPVNKSSRGRELYQAKQRELLASGIHLVEIDLLLRGLHTVAVPLEMLERRIENWDFLVAVNRHPRRHAHEVYAFTLADRLPRIRIPLAAPDPDVVLDLHAAYDQCYDEAYYRDTIDYRSDPPKLRLSNAKREWLDRQLHTRGLR